MHDDVTEPRDPAKPRHELGRQDAEAYEGVDRGGIIGDIDSRAGRKMGRDIEAVLCTELKTALDDPPLLEVSSQLGWASRVAAQRLNRCIEREEMAAYQRGVEHDGTHRPKFPPRIRARVTASILASCGTKSQ